jgi:hypothetical protein
MDRAADQDLLVRARSVDVSGGPAPCGFFTGRNRLHRCGSTVRTIQAGLLGPDATRIAYRVAGRPRTGPTLGGVGGYLVVQRCLTPPMRKLPSGVRYAVLNAMSFSPASQVLTRVDYRDGSSCAVHVTTRIDGSCPHPPRQTIRVRVMTRAGKRHELARLVVAPEASGKLDKKIEVPLPPRVRSVCIAASARLDRPKCPPRPQGETDTTWIRVKRAPEKQP